MNRTNVSFAFAGAYQLVSLVVFEANLTGKADIFIRFKDFLLVLSQVVGLGIFAETVVVILMSSFEDLHHALTESEGLTCSYK